MSKPLVIRVETSQGQYRINFPSRNVTFGDLQSKIQTKYGIVPDAQVLSRGRPPNLDFIENVSQNSKLTDIGLQHGAQIWLIMVKSQEDEYRQNNKKKESQRTNNPHSSPMDQDEKKSNNNRSKLKQMNTTLSGGKMTYQEIGKKVAKDDEEKEANRGPKHIPFHEFIEERQRKFAKTQPWNIDPPKYNYKRMY